MLNKQGKYAEAEEVLRGLLPLLQNRMGMDSPQSLGCMRHLMEAVGGQGRWEEAREMCEEGLGLVDGMGGEEKGAEMEAMTEMEKKIEQGGRRKR